MKKIKKIKINLLLVFIGVLLLAIGLYFIKTISYPRGFMRAFPYVCVGLGCGIFGHSIGNIFFNRIIKTDSKIEKQIEIEKNDERNIIISNKAKAKGYDAMTLVFSALMISFALMNVDIIATLLLVFTYLFVQGYTIYYRFKYDKEM